MARNDAPILAVLAHGPDFARFDFDMLITLHVRLINCEVRKRIVLKVEQMFLELKNVGGILKA